MNTSNFLRETIDLVKQLETRFLELGARLYQIRTKEMWKEMYDSYQEFLDVAKISPGNASILASVHEHYVVNGGMKQEKLIGAPYSTLYEAIPLIERDGVEKVVAKAKLLTRAEIKEEVREEKHGECEHELITICGRCHKRVHETKQS